MNSSLTNYSEKLIPDIIDLQNYIVSKGILLPTQSKLSQLDNATDEELISAYNALSSSIQPATLESIRYIDKEILVDGTRKWYQVSLFSRSLYIAFISLILIVIISLSPEVNNETQSEGLLSSSGKTLFLNLTFILSSSLLGVMFYLLKTISDKIRSYTLVPQDLKINASSILIGVMSGFIISELFVISSENFSSSIEFQKMTLALLGGFSSDAIFSILKGIVDKIKLFTTS